MTNTTVSPREQVDLVYQLSSILNTGLDKEAIAICISLLEDGINPEALALCLKEIKKNKA